MECRCRKSARHAGAKHKWKLKGPKTATFARLLEVEISQKRAPLWREAHLEVKIYKKTIFGPLFEVEMSKRARRFAGSTCGSQNVKITTCSGQSWKSISCQDVEKANAVVVRTTFPSPKC